MLTSQNEIFILFDYQFIVFRPDVYYITPLIFDMTFLISFANWLQMKDSHAEMFVILFIDFLVSG